MGEDIVLKSNECNEQIKIAIDEGFSCMSSTNVINTKAVNNYLKPEAKIYNDAKEFLNEFNKMVLKQAFSQIEGLRERAIRKHHICFAIVYVALLISSSKGGAGWTITKK